LKPFNSSMSQARGYSRSRGLFSAAEYFRHGAHFHVVDDIAPLKPNFWRKSPVKFSSRNVAGKRII
jgi:hypothetical protein